MATNLNPGNAENVPDPGTYGNPDATESINQLNSLLRGEISAAETYRKALDRIADSSDVSARRNLSLLRDIQTEHGRTAQQLRERIRSLGGEASDTSGAWGVWANFVQGAANLFGDSAALKSLKEGEVHGLKDFRDALDELDPQSREMVSGQYIPNQQRHIQVLDQLINQQMSA